MPTTVVEQLFILKFIHNYLISNTITYYAEENSVTNVNLKVGGPK